MTSPDQPATGGGSKFFDAFMQAMETAASEELGAGEKLERLLGLALAQARAARGSVMLMDEKRSPAVRASVGSPGEETFPEGGFGRIADLFGEDGRVRRYMENGVLRLPIILQGRAEGVMTAVREAGGDFTDEDEAALAAFASVMANVALEERMKKDSERLKEQERLRNDMIDMIVHDLKGPAGEIMSNLDLLGESVGDNAAAREALSSAEGSAEELMEMIMNILDIARMEDGKFHVKPERLDIVKLARERTEKLKAVAGRDGKEVSFESGEKSLVMEADRRVLNRVLWNLLSNANNHTISGDSIKVSVMREGDAAVIRVRDTGPGIPPGDLERIFDKFCQGAGGGGKSATGLGLAFCRMAMDACGGEITAESEPGRGAAFHVRLRAGHRGGAPRCATAAARTKSPGETESLGERIGQALAGGDVVALVGGLGAGKTVLARGILRGLGVDEKTAVRSPTFTLVNEYHGRLNARHADLYRVEGEEELETVGLFDERPGVVTIIEWADRLPEKEREKATVMIRITDISGTEREISISAPETALAGAGLEVCK